MRRQTAPHAVPIRAMLLLAGTCLATTPPAHATALSWLTVTGGSAGLPANWSPAQLPGVSDALTFNLPNTFTVSFPVGVPQVTSHTYKRGLVTLSMTAPHNTSSFVRVGDVAGDSAQVVLTSGSFHAGTGVTIGAAAAAVGTLTVDNEGSLLDTTGAGSDLVVGSAGTGTLNISDGGRVSPLDDAFIAVSAGSTGHVNVSGGGGLPLPAPASMLDLSGPGQDLTVGQSGDGFLDVSAGGRVDADEVFVSLNPGSTGTVTVSGSGGFLNAASQINVSTTLHLGDNPGVSASGGSASLAVNAGGQVTVGGTTRIGDPTSGIGSGTLTVSAGGVFSTGSLIATDSGGFLNLLGGTLILNGGALTVAHDLLSLNGSGGAQPTVELRSGASCVLTAPAAPFEALVLGNSARAAMKVLGGSHLTINTGDVIVGNLAGSDGQLASLDVGSLITAPADRAIVVGDAGRGDFRVQGDSRAVCGDIILGRAVTGVGSLLVSRGNSYLDVAGALTIGGGAASAGGAGSVTIGGAGPEAGGTINVTSGGAASVSVRAWGAGDSLTIGEGGLLNCDGQVVVSTGASFTLAGGTLLSSDLQLSGSGANYSVSGVIGARLFVGAASTTVNLSGNLSVQESPIHSFLFQNSGSIEVGDHVLSIGGGPSIARLLNTCHLGSAGRISASVPLQVLPSHTLSGDGTVDAPIINAGLVVSQGGGLTFTKVLSGVGQGISGSRLTFGNGGGFTGSGVVPNAVTTGFNSVITATGDLTIGDPANLFGFDGTAGKLVIAGDFDVVLRDANAAGLNDVEFPSPGAGSPSVSCFGGISLNVGGRVTGSGVVAGSRFASVRTQGSIDPGSPSTPGDIAIEGEFFLLSGARVELDIFGPDSHDTLSTRAIVDLAGSPPSPTGFPSDIHLGGTLVVRVDPAHTPAPGETHRLIIPGCRDVLPPLVFSTFHFGFDALELPPHWLVRIVGSGASFQRGVFVTYCPSDFNSDGDVNPDDLGDFITCFFTDPPCPGADYNADGDINPDDLGDFITAFFTPCG